LSRAKEGRREPNTIIPINFRKAYTGRRAGLQEGGNISLHLEELRRRTTEEKETL